MTLSRYRNQWLAPSMQFSQNRWSGGGPRALAVALILLASTAINCTSSKPANANSTGASSLKPNGNGNATSDSRVSSPAAEINIKEPERYSVTMTISTQTSSDVSASTATPAPRQFGFAKLGADRRWELVVPAPLGQVVYLEKSGLKYLVLVERKQYVELTPDAVGFQPASVLTPAALAERLKPGVQHEQLGLDTVNGHTAVKYRLIGTGDGSRQTDEMIFVDQDTGLPLRWESNGVQPAGTKSRVVVEARDLRLNPDRLLFDVPAGMKKVTPHEARPQIESFVNEFRLVADFAKGKQTTPPVASANRSIANKSANRRGH